MKFVWPLSLPLTLPLTLGLTLVMSACGGHKRSPDGPTPTDERQPPQGELATQFTEIQLSEDVETCDTRVKDAQIEIATALDKKQSEIVEVIKKLPPDKIFRRVNIEKDFYVRESVTVPTPEQNLKSYTTGWKTIIEYYSKIKDSPVDVKWASLNSAVRSILMNDQLRVLDGVNLYLDKDSELKIKSLQTVVQACSTNLSACLPLTFNESDQAFLKDQPYYRAYLARFALATTPADKSSVLSHFYIRLSNDLRRFSFTTNDHVSRNANSLTLEIDGSVFTDGLPKIQQYIETIWKSDLLSLSIAWKSIDAVAGVYKILIEPGMGGRSFVKFNDQTVHLYSDVRAKSIAHEIGHVLGFRDHYYTQWKPESCLYEDVYSEQDLMAEPTTGVVTADEWKTLDEKYPAVKPEPN